MFVAISLSCISGEVHPNGHNIQLSLSRCVSREQSIHYNDHIGKNILLNAKRYVNAEHEIHSEVNGNLMWTISLICLRTVYLRCSVWSVLNANKFYAQIISEDPTRYHYF